MGLAARVAAVRIGSSWTDVVVQIGNMAETLDPDADGDLALLIQHDSPGARGQASWLPAPVEGFFLVMRMYQPQEQMYRGKYTVPLVTRTN